MPWHAGSNAAKHLEFGHADEHAEDVFDFEGDDARWGLDQHRVHS